MTRWFKTAEDLPTVRLVLLYFCGVLIAQGPLGNFTLHYSLTWGLLLNQLGVMVLPVALLCIMSRMDTRRLFPFHGVNARDWRYVLLTSVAVILLSDCALAATEQWLPIPPQIAETLDALLDVQSRADFLKKLALFCILPAIAEEFYFRGFCQTSFAHRIGIAPAIFLSALLFALAHGNIWYLHLYFGLGYFLGWLFEKTGSLWPSIVAHFMNNTWTFIGHSLGWDDIVLELPTQLATAGVSLAVLIWGIRRWRCSRSSRLCSPT